MGHDGYIATEKGNSVKPWSWHNPYKPYMTLNECEKACTDMEGCNSFWYCPNHNNRCYLYDRVFEGNEPTSRKWYCSTYYKERM